MSTARDILKKQRESAIKLEIVRRKIDREFTNLLIPLIKVVLEKEQKRKPLENQNRMT